MPETWLTLEKVCALTGWTEGHARRASRTWPTRLTESRGSFFQIINTLWTRCALFLHKRCFHLVVPKGLLHFVIGHWSFVIFK